jgi:hypothetical protein
MKDTEEVMPSTADRTSLASMDAKTTLNLDIFLALLYNDAGLARGTGEGRWETTLKTKGRERDVSSEIMLLTLELVHLQRRVVDPAW